MKGGDIINDEVYQNFKYDIEVVYVWKDGQDYTCMFNINSAWIEVPIDKDKVNATLNQFVNDRIFVEIGKPYGDD